MSDEIREPIVDLDHDHDDLTALLYDLSALVEQASVDATRERALHESRELLRYFRADMASHFELEEADLFPVLRDELPSRTGVVDGLALAHGRFTALVEEIETTLLSDAVTNVALLECKQRILRLVDNFKTHSQVECELVKTMDERIVDIEKRKMLRERLGGL